MPPPSPPIEIRPACPADLAAPIPPEPGLPDAAGIPAPITGEEIAAVRAYLTHHAASLEWGRDLSGRLARAREQACGALE